jgi:hypothetical protein
VSARKWKGAQEELGEQQGHKVLRVTQDQKKQNLDTHKKLLVKRPVIRPPKSQRHLSGLAGHCSLNKNKGRFPCVFLELFFVFCCCFRFSGLLPPALRLRFFAPPVSFIALLCVSQQGE